MHMGQGSSPTTCCKYMPKDSKPTHNAATAASTVRGRVCNHIQTKFKTETTLLSL